MSSKKAAQREQGIHAQMVADFMAKQPTPEGGISARTRSASSADEVTSNGTLAQPEPPPEKKQAPTCPPLPFSSASRWRPASTNNTAAKEGLQPQVVVTRAVEAGQEATISAAPAGEPADEVENFSADALFAKFGARRTGTSTSARPSRTPSAASTANPFAEEHDNIRGDFRNVLNNGARKIPGNVSQSQPQVGERARGRAGHVGGNIASPDNLNNEFEIKQERQQRAEARRIRYLEQISAANSGAETGKEDWILPTNRRPFQALALPLQPLLTQQVQQEPPEKQEKKELPVAPPAHQTPTAPPPKSALQQAPPAGTLETLEQNEVLPTKQNDAAALAAAALANSAQQAQPLSPPASGTSTTRCTAAGAAAPNAADNRAAASNARSSVICPGNATCIGNSQHSHSAITGGR